MDNPVDNLPLPRRIILIGMAVGLAMVFILIIAVLGALGGG